jgi:hypothetical protein
MKIYRLIYDRTKAWIKKRRAIPQRSVTKQDRAVRTAFLTNRKIFPKKTIVWSEFDNQKMVRKFVDANREDLEEKALRALILKTKQPLTLFPDPFLMVSVTRHYTFSWIVIRMATKKHYDHCQYIYEKIFGKRGGGAHRASKNPTAFFELARPEPIEAVNPHFDIGSLSARIDPKIAPIIKALQILGIRTTGSCEGHLDRGSSPYPYIHCYIEDFNKMILLLRNFNPRQGKHFWIRPLWFDQFRLEIKGSSLKNSQKIMRAFGKYLSQRAT